MRPRILACLIVLVLGACDPPAPPIQDMPPYNGLADLIVENARVWTGDPARRDAEAFIVVRDRIVEVGLRADLDHRRGPRTKIINASGRRVIPGLIDSHVHLVSGGLSLSRVQLRDVRSFDEFVVRIRREVVDRKLNRNDWLIGRGWSTESWTGPRRQLSRDSIDFNPGARIILYRMDGHCALVNTAALHAAGIDEKGPPDPPGGLIERDPKNHLPTGIVKDAAIDLIERVIPKPTLEQQTAAVEAAMREANRFGITTVNTMSEWADLKALRLLHDVGNDTLRVGVYVMEKNWPDYLTRVRAFPIYDNRLWIDGFKDYMDGSLGSRTAYMHEPYSDQPTNRGLLSDSMHPQQHMVINLEAAEQAGYQCAIHSIGDEANHLLLDMYAELGRTNRNSMLRPRIEHAQHLLPADIPRFGREGVVASMQPLHKADDGRYAEAAIGPQRCRSSYAFADLLRGNAHLAFGSDWPVVTINPFPGVHAAVTGRTLDGRAWMTHENITVEQALTAYTNGSAYACFREKELGRIAPGYLADFVILDDDPFTIDPDKLAQVRVRETWLGGRRVWPPTR